MNTEQIRNQAEEHILHTYNRFPVAFVRGEGMKLYDAEGKEYLDFAAGIAVHALGHSHPVLTAALQDQAAKLVHISNLYYHDLLGEAAQKLVRASGMHKVFFTNSGTEAVEGAIKVARKYAWLKDGRNDHEIIAMEDSFHGRSLGALSVTGNEHYQEPFRPLIGGIRFAKFNDINSVLEQINDRTCAIILETVQGEGGIYPADPEFLRALRRLCDERDMLLILDEIQCGMGRCGVSPDDGVSGGEARYFAWQNYGVMPDVMTTAKALGCGVPVGAFVLNRKAAENSLVPGDHGTTYGGNPLACRAVSTVFDLFEEQKILRHVKEMTPYLEEKLDELVRDLPFLKGRRGRGFLLGLIIKTKENSPGDPEAGKAPSPGAFLGSALQHGLLLISAGTDVLRLAPPLIAKKEDIDAMCGLFREAAKPWIIA